MAVSFHSQMGLFLRRFIGEIWKSIIFYVTCIFYLETFHFLLFGDFASRQTQLAVSPDLSGFYSLMQENRELKIVK
jgi:hypothetical protein